MCERSYVQYCSEVQYYHHVLGILMRTFWDNLSGQVDDWTHRVLRLDLQDASCWVQNWGQGPPADRVQLPIIYGRYKDLVNEI